MSERTDHEHRLNKDEDIPFLSEDVRRHLGRILASAYEEPSNETDSAERFSNLIVKLKVALDRDDLSVSSNFQVGLLDAAPALRRFAKSLTHDMTAADDLVQETMLRAWRAQASFVPGTNLEAWTFTIMRNQFYSRHRKNRHEVQDENDVHASRLTTLPEQEGHLDLQDVHTALGRLTPVMREALVLIAIENLSYDEAAAVMECQVGTVKSRVWRARAQLARILGYDGAAIGGDSLMSSAMEDRP
ncbi:sigma-70 family RNA polymerase sigma factor [Methylobacterium sp. J-076]|nr:sigma-70 family RNA polymerase sigma factor [Methylobacterium sp. J-076]MCJ2011800.1 sigma-70 family RNA polymerase sigma factor [Methylobacterium sp. J-076]